jgi:ferredoxin
MEQDGKAKAKNIVPLDMEASCYDAAQQCPVEVITITK